MTITERTSAKNGRSSGFMRQDKKMREKLEEVWPFSSHFEYAAELGLSLRMLDPARFREFDSRERRSRYPLPQALGFEYVRYLEERDPEWLFQAAEATIPRMSGRVSELLLAEMEEIRPIDFDEPLPDASKPPRIIRAWRRRGNNAALRLSSWTDEAFPEREEIQSGRRATQRDLARVHMPGYIQGLEALAQAGGGYLTPETRVHKDSPDEFYSAAGAMLDAIDLALRERENILVEAFPGSHHAERNRGGGTCLINNLAVGAEYALQKPGVRRIAIVDLDVHHGNGIEEIFWDSGDIWNISIHRKCPFYPGTGSRHSLGGGEGRKKTLNVEVSREEDWGGAVKYATAALDMWNPDLVLVQLSTDAHWADPVSDLGAKDGDYKDAAEALVSLGVPVVAELGASLSERAWVGGLRSWMQAF